MKKGLTLLVLLVLLIGATGVSASQPLGYDELAPHVLGFEIPTGQYCVTDYFDGHPHTECYDPVCPNCYEVDCPECNTCETCEECQACEDCDKEVKDSCNRGIGNGAEDCDPGNSGGKPGSAGEDNE